MKHYDQLQRKLAQILSKNFSLASLPSFFAFKEELSKELDKIRNHREASKQKSGMIHQYYEEENELYWLLSQVNSAIVLTVLLKDNSYTELLDQITTAKDPLIELFQNKEEEDKLYSQYQRIYKLEHRGTVEDVVEAEEILPKIRAIEERKKTFTDPAYKSLLGESITLIHKEFSRWHCSSLRVEQFIHGTKKRLSNLK